MVKSLEGSFIVFEGTDGAGKSTQGDMLHDRLVEEGYNTLRLSTPGNEYRRDPLVKQYNETGVSLLGATTLSVMAAADRFRTVDSVIKPHMSEGGVVVCDRYKYSASAYFRKRGADMDVVETLHSRLLVPDFAVLCAIDAVTRAARLRERATTDDWEEQDMKYLDGIQQDMLGNWPEDFLVVNSREPKEEIHAQVIEYVGLNA